MGMIQNPTRCMSHPKPPLIGIAEVLMFVNNPNRPQALRRQTVKKVLESSREEGRTFGHLGLHPKGLEVLRRVWQMARENATPFTPMEANLL